LYKSLSALVDEFLAVLDLGLDAAQLIEVFSVDALELLDFLYLEIFLFTDDDLSVLVVCRTFKPTFHSNKGKKR